MHVLGRFRELAVAPTIAYLYAARGTSETSVQERAIGSHAELSVRQHGKRCTGSRRRRLDRQAVGGRGILPAHKTAGGHRKLLLADVLRLTRAGDFPQLDLSELRFVEKMQGRLDPKALAQQLLTALKRGDGDAVRSLIHGAYQSGVPMETLADFVIAPTMRQLGHEWEIGRIEVLHEHRGTQLCVSALYELKVILEAQADRDRPLAVGGNPEGDYYILANLLAAMVLLDSGWQAIDLGPHTPIFSFRQAVSKLRPRLLWISVSELVDRDRFLAEYRELYREAELAGVAVVIGGRALVGPVRSAMAYTCYGDGLRHLAAFARSHHGPSRRPRRGRPDRRL